MEQSAPKISPPTAIKLDWRDDKPYVEVWDGGHLLVAGWVYEHPNYVEPPTINDYWDKYQRDNNNVTLTTEDPTKLTVVPHKGIFGDRTLD